MTDNHSTRALLERYALRSDLDADEGTKLAHILEFIANEPRCFDRECLPGHFTASAWILDPTHQRVVLLRHQKLGKWLQPGGHADGDSNLARVAHREATEETGVKDLALLSSEIFDVDIHNIPARGKVQEHLHFDVRFLFAATRDTALISNHESTGITWIEREQIPKLSQEKSILRMARKWDAWLR